jgi:hypothetical protein
MRTFNQYGFLEDLRDLIKEENPSDVWEFIHEEIDRAVIYYADCFAIVQELFVTDWKDNEFGEITNIQQLAYTALYDLVVDNIEVEA